MRKSYQQGDGNDRRKQVRRLVEALKQAVAELHSCQLVGRPIQHAAVAIAVATQRLCRRLHSSAAVQAQHTAASDRLRGASCCELAFNETDGTLANHLSLHAACEQLCEQEAGRAELCAGSAQQQPVQNIRKRRQRVGQLRVRAERGWLQRQQRIDDACRHSCHGIERADCCVLQSEQQ